jgi:predicted RNase H-like HicB family nuclease
MPSAYGLIHREGGISGISFPDFPGVVATGKTADAAILKGSEALSFHVAGMAADNDPVPVPRDLEDLIDDPKFQEDSQGATVVLVSFELPGKAVRINISIEEHLLAAIDQAAKSEGKSRSAYLADAAKKRIRAA